MSEIFITNIINNILQDRKIKGNSLKQANWMSKLVPTTCQYCIEQHGKIVDISVLKNKTEVAAHPNCRCVYVSMRTKRVGTATKMGVNGADVQLFYFNKLPNYYVDKKRLMLQDGRRNINIQMIFYQAK